MMITIETKTTNVSAIHTVICKNKKKHVNNSVKRIYTCMDRVTIALKVSDGGNN